MPGKIGDVRSPTGDLPQELEDKKTTSQELAETIKHFSLETTAHGFARAASTNSRLSRWLWILLLWVAFGFSCYHIFVSFRKFLNFPAKTDVCISLGDFSVKFPAITFCNTNYLKKSSQGVINVVKELNKTRDAFGDTSNKRRENLERVLYFMSGYKEEQVKDFGHQAKDMIIACNAPGRWAQYPCDYRNFTWFYDQIHGNCYTFNAARNQSEPVYIEDAGHRHGLHLTLFVEAEEYWSYLSDSLGFVISIHDREQLPFPAETGYFISPGMATSVALQSKVLKRLPWPYDHKECETKRGIPGVTPSNTIYSEEGCRKSCVARMMLDKCKCVSLLYRLKPSCNPFNKTQGSCIEDVLRSRSKESMSSCNCPPACREDVFTTSMSSSVWPTRSYMSNVLNTLPQGSQAQKVVTNLSSARENMAHVMVYFPTLMQESIVQKPAYQIESLLGDIGGQMGLFIGISVLTLVEFIALLWDLIAIVIFKNKKNTAAPDGEKP
ncbi:degenerin deg-1 isoform X2 [Nematostella vectensis]|uniref:degenerin deg-1 isoform X2 n=1 Tax=Nematostella vectensis TaxID=45351 RepID=UPI0020777E91|nr:degenerin deg-1 isoform X2 [Nematostella vectensis]